MKVWIFSAICFLLITCITRYDPEIKDNTLKLVVDGVITDQPGPHRIRLLYSAPYNNESEIVQFISGANIQVEDNEGGVVSLTQVGTGTYATPANFVAQLGRTYSLKFSLPNGKQYRSYPEEIRQLSPIDTIVGSYRELVAKKIRGEFDLSIETTDLPSLNDYYQFKWYHYNFEPFCSYNLDSFSGRTYVIDCCDSCWSIDQCYGCVNIMSDRFINGASLKVPMVTIPYDTKDPYFILVEKRSLTESAYKFWKNVSTQVQNSGGIFDSPPITIRGNVYNVDDPDDQVLGYFGASSVVMKSMHFRRDKINKIPYGEPRDLVRFTSSCIPCSVGLTRTTQSPFGW